MNLTKLNLGVLSLGLLVVISARQKVEAGIGFGIEIEPGVEIRSDDPELGKTFDGSPCASPAPYVKVKTNTGITYGGRWAGFTPSKAHDFGVKKPSWGISISQCVCNKYLRAYDQQGLVGSIATCKDYTGKIFQGLVAFQSKWLEVYNPNSGQCIPLESQVKSNYVFYNPKKCDQSESLVSCLQETREIVANRTFLGSTHSRINPITGASESGNLHAQSTTFENQVNCDGSSVTKSTETLDVLLMISELL